MTGPYTCIVLQVLGVLLWRTGAEGAGLQVGTATYQTAPPREIGRYTPTGVRANEAAVLLDGRSQVPQPGRIVGQNPGDDGAAVAELLGDYFLSPEERSAAGAGKKLKKLYKSLALFVLCLVLWAALYHSYMEPLAIDFQRNYRRRFPGRAPYKGEAFTLFMASPPVAGLSAFIIMGLLASLANISIRAYKYRAKLLDLEHLKKGKQYSRSGQLPKSPIPYPSPP